MSTYQGETSSDDSSQETARDGVVERSRVGDSGLGGDGGGSVGSDDGTCQYTMSKVIPAELAVMIEGSLPVGGVLGRSGGHEGSNSEGDELELHFD